MSIPECAKQARRTPARAAGRVDGDGRAYASHAHCGSRMPRHRILPMLVVLATLAPLVAADETHTGTLRQGESDTFVVDTRGDLCTQVITTHTVTLTHEPTTDELILVVTGQGAVRTEDGFAQTTFTTPTGCAFFTVHVVGAHVQDEAHYTLNIQSSAGGGGEPI